MRKKIMMRYCLVLLLLFSADVTWAQESKPSGDSSALQESTIEVRVVVDRDGSPAIGADVFLLDLIANRARRQVQVDANGDPLISMRKILKPLGRHAVASKSGSVHFSQPQMMEGHGYAVIAMLGASKGSTLISIARIGEGPLEIRIGPNEDPRQMVKVVGHTGKYLANTPVVMQGGQQRGRSRRSLKYRRIRFGKTGPNGEAAQFESLIPPRFMKQGHPLRFLALIPGAPDAKVEIPMVEYGKAEVVIVAPVCGTIAIELVDENDKSLDLPFSMHAFVSPEKRRKKFEKMPRHLVIASPPMFSFSGGKGEFLVAATEPIVSIDVTAPAYYPTRMNIKGPANAGQVVHVKVEVKRLPQLRVLLKDDKGAILKNQAIDFSIEDSTGWTNTNHGTLLTDGDGRFVLSLKFPRATNSKRSLKLTWRIPGKKDVQKAEIPVLQTLEYGVNDLGSIQLKPEAPSKK